MSFFDEDEGESTRPSPRPARPRSPQHPAGGAGVDEHTLMVRRRVALGVGVVLLIVIALAINGCLKSRKVQALKDYNRSVGALVKESDAQVSHPLFSALAGASGKSPLDVETTIDGLRSTAEAQAAHARSLNVPSEMQDAQRNFTLVMNLREEGLKKIAGLVRTALGGQGAQASTLMAGNMGIFLTSDILYSQRVAPLVEQTLGENGVHGEEIASTRFLPNVGWLEASTLRARLTGQSSGSGASSGTIAPGTHGHAITGVSVGANALQPSPALNHVSGGASPTFTVMVQNSGGNPETNVKVEVTVTSSGKSLKATQVVGKTEPGTTTSVEVPVSGVPLGAASQVLAYVQPVPGEKNLENNKGTFLVVFEH
ncbi:MAG TPA: hypothetical protein VGX16_06415 [Solirubrobacteraceae bacterium]|nr:hypothetical protein [Solirubrobacteraceae bacterium]